MRPTLKLLFALALLASSPVAAQPPAPAPDPLAWWTGTARIGESRDPLGDRRSGGDDPAVTVDNGVQPLLYRLWGLPPLHTMVLREGEVVIEVWARLPEDSRQAIVRITLRRDGDVFLQARAGLGCCLPEIGRRVDIDQKLEQADRELLRRLARDTVWDQPRNVQIERPDDIEPLCGGGVDYDLTLLDYHRSRHLRRACNDEAIGQVADVLQAVLALGMGRDGRFDVLFRGRTDFAAKRTAYQALLAQGGKLSAKAFNP